MTRRRPGLPADDEGSIALWVLLLGVALLGALGLVTDGGRALAARSDAADVAQECARAGAREIDLAALRSNAQDLTVTTPGASAAVDAFNAADQDSDHATCSLVGVDTRTGAVTVSVQDTVHTALLQLVGVSTLSSEQQATAIPQRGA